MHTISYWRFHFDAVRCMHRLFRRPKFLRFRFCHHDRTEELSSLCLEPRILLLVFHRSTTNVRDGLATRVLVMRRNGVHFTFHLVTSDHVTSRQPIPCRRGSMLIHSPDNLIPFSKRSWKNIKIKFVNDYWINFSKHWIFFVVSPFREKNNKSQIEYHGMGKVGEQISQRTKNTIKSTVWSRRRFDVITTLSLRHIYVGY